MIILFLSVLVYYWTCVADVMQASFQILVTYIAFSGKRTVFVGPCHFVDSFSMESAWPSLAYLLAWVTSGSILLHRQERFCIIIDHVYHSRDKTFNLCWFNSNSRFVWINKANIHFQRIETLTSCCRWWTNIKHHLTSLKTDLIFLQPRVLEWKFPWNWFPNTWQFSLIFKPFQVFFIHYKSRIATAIRGL